VFIFSFPAASIYFLENPFQLLILSFSFLRLMITYFFNLAKKGEVVSGLALCQHRKNFSMRKLDDATPNHEADGSLSLYNPLYYLSKCYEVFLERY